MAERSSTHRDIRSCPYCGFLSYDSEERFCGLCGTELAESSVDADGTPDWMIARAIHLARISAEDKPRVMFDAATDYVRLPPDRKSVV